MAFKIRARAKDSLVHAIQLKGEMVVIERRKPPIISVLYDPASKTSELLSREPLENSKEFTHEQIKAALKKAVAFAKHNIKYED